MPYVQSFGVMTVIAAVIAVPVLAQQASPGDSPAANAPANPPGVAASTNNPNLAVATVKLESGVRLGKLIGAAVHGDTDQQVGTVDDLIMRDGDKVALAIVSVGGFLGIGAKLVAFPFDQLKWDGKKATIQGVTKDSLNAMPSFEY